MQNEMTMLAELCKAGSPATIMAPDLRAIFSGRFLSNTSDDLTFEVFDKPDKPFRPFSIVCVTYFYMGRSCVFVSVVFDYKQLSSGSPQLTIKMPEQIAATETRQALRVPLRDNPGLAVHVNKGLKKIPAKPIDISLGGISLELPRSPDMGFKLNSQMKVTLTLENQQLDLIGEVRRHEGHQYGLYFESVQDSFEEGGVLPAYRNIVHALFRKWMRTREGGP